MGVEGQERGASKGREGGRTERGVPAFNEGAQKSYASM